MQIFIVNIIVVEINILITFIINYRRRSNFDAATHFLFYISKHARSSNSTSVRHLKFGAELQMEE